MLPSISCLSYTKFLIFSERSSLAFLTGSFLHAGAHCTAIFPNLRRISIIKQQIETRKSEIAILSTINIKAISLAEYYRGHISTNHRAVKVQHFTQNFNFKLSRNLYENKIQLKYEHEISAEIGDTGLLLQTNHNAGNRLSTSIFGQCQNCSDAAENRGERERCTSRVRTERPSEKVRERRCT